MLADSVLELRSALQGQHILFTYSGHVSETLLFSLGETVKRQLDINHTDRSVRKKVFSVFVEQVQNVIRYSSEHEGQPDPASERFSAGIVSLGHENGRYFVICGNAVDGDSAGRLKERLETLQSMDQQELKTHYREKLREEPDESSMGATIGLIEIARRVSAPLEFDFLDMGGNEKFFVLKAFI